MRIDELTWQQMRSDLSRDKSPISTLQQINADLIKHNTNLVDLNRALQFTDEASEKKIQSKIKKTYKLIKNLRDMKQEIIDTHSYSEVLIQNNFKFEGEGLYGEVYSNGPYVAKIFDLLDTCFLEFIHFCRARKNNPFLPKFSRPTKVISDRGESYLVFSETLIPVADEERPLLTQTKRDLHQLHHDLDHDMFKKIESEYPGLLQTLIDLQKHFKRKNCAWDTHENNYMKRGDQLVITDPYATLL